MFHELIHSERISGLQTYALFKGPSSRELYKTCLY